MLPFWQSDVIGTEADSIVQYAPFPSKLENKITLD